MSIVVGVARSPHLRRSGWWCIVGNNSKQMAVACVSSGVIAAGISALTNPPVADSLPALTISVNRMSKGDRLRLAPRLERPGQIHTPNDGVGPVENKLAGCDPSVSLLAAPQPKVAIRCVT